MPLQELQRLIVESLNVLIYRGMRACVKNQQLGIADIRLHAFCKSTARGRDIVAPKAYLRGRCDSAELLLRVVSHDSIRLPQKTVDRLGRPAPHKSRERLNVIRLGDVQLRGEAPWEQGMDHHLGHAVQCFGCDLKVLDKSLQKGV